METIDDVDSSSAQKGEAVQAQLAVWDRLMHLTIKTHAALRSFNQLPRGEIAKELFRNANEDTKTDLSKLRGNIFETTSTFLDIENIFMKQSKKHQEASDEEIESSEDEKENEKSDDEGEEDEELENDDEEMEDNKEHSVKANRGHSNSRLHHLQKTITLLDSTYSKTRSSVLTKWDDRTRLVGRKSKSNDALESSIMKQIDKVLADRYRLLRRTQTKRSDNDRLDGTAEASQDSEIFDDDDFYQALLKDFIDQKASQTNDPVAMSRQFLELQKLRQKRSKKVVDTKATKGRKIRYVTIPKMVNFFPACPESVEWSHEKRNELFRSLFK